MTIDFGAWSPLGTGETWPPGPDEQAEQVLEWLTVPSEGSGPLGEDHTFEPMVITVPNARREAILRGAGWQRVTVQVLLRSFDNEPLHSHLCYLQYTGPRDETNTARSDLRGGTASFPDFWIKPQGVLRLLAIPIAGSIAAGGPLLEGSVAVPERIGSSYLAFTAVQDHQDVQVRASSQQAVAEQMQLQGNVKFSILGTAEIGGGASSSTTRTRTSTDELTYTVRIGKSALTISQAAR
jgi:hypothetical protein